MKTLIRIDPRTIKKNPNGGQTEHYVYGKKKFEQIKVTHIQGKCYRVERFIGTGFTGANELENPTRVSVHEGKYDFPPVSSSFTYQPFNTIQSFEPEPMYFYEYMETDVSCKDCLKSFPHHELLEDYNDWDYGSGCPSEKCETICPHCRKWWCCEVELEKLTNEELAKRMSEGINEVVIE